MSTSSLRRSGRLVAALAVFGGSLLLPVAAADAAPGTTTRINATPGGGQSTGPATVPALSSDGSAVAFLSSATDLAGISGSELYVKYDTYFAALQVPQRVATGPADGMLGEHDVDADGSRVVFDADSANVSQSSDTVLCGGANCRDVFVKDTQDGKATKVSVSFLDGDEGNGQSAHGRISDDGRRIVFASTSSNLHLTDGGGDWDIFVRQLLLPTPPEDEEDIDDGRTYRLTTTEPGSVTGEPVISADGSTVAFWSTSTTLGTGAPDGVNLFTVTPTSTPTVTWVAHLDSTKSLDSYAPTLSGDGNLIGFVSRDALVAQDTNSLPDLYVRNRATGARTLVGWSSAGARASDPAGLELADGGHHALFVGGAGLMSGTPAGRRYVYVQDLDTGVVRVASLAEGGAVLDADAHTGPRSLSPDGSTVVFSTAAAAIATDTNGTEDVYRRVLGDDPPFPPLGGDPGDLETNLDGDGEPVGTGDEATEDLPVVATIDPPVGAAGALTVDLQDSDPDAPAGYSFFGSQLAIEAPASTFDEPYVVTFTVDASELGAVAPEDVQVFRNGVPVADCTDPNDAVPDPCVAARAEGSDGDAVLTVRTSHFSEWTLGALDYDVAGPFSPVDPSPTLNTVKAGAAVPVKFRLGGDRGLDVFADGYPGTQTAACGGSADAIEQTVTSGSSSLTFDVRTDTYTYVWKTPKASGCRDLVLRFRDGTELTARFQLK